METRSENKNKRPGGVCWCFQWLGFGWGLGNLEKGVPGLLSADWIEGTLGLNREATKTRWDPGTW